MLGQEFGMQGFTGQGLGLGLKILGLGFRSQDSCFEARLHRFSRS